MFLYWGKYFNFYQTLVIGNKNLFIIKFTLINLL